MTLSDVPRRLAYSKPDTKLHHSPHNAKFPLAPALDTIILYKIFIAGFQLTKSLPDGIKLLGLGSDAEVEAVAVHPGEDEEEHGEVAGGEQGVIPGTDVGLQAEGERVDDRAEVDRFAEHVGRD